MAAQHRAAFDRRLSHLHQSSLLLQALSPPISAWLSAQSQLLSRQTPPQSTRPLRTSPPPPGAAGAACESCGTLSIPGQTVAVVEAREHPLGKRGWRCGVCHRFTALAESAVRGGVDGREVRSGERLGPGRRSALSSLGGSGGGAEVLSAAQRRRQRAKARSRGLLGAPVAPVGCAGSGTGLLSARDSLKGKEAAQHMQPLVKQAARCPPERMTEEKGAFGLGLFDFMKG